MINEQYIKECPYCNIPIEIESINCGIFRCGVIKSGQINPHASKEQIEHLKSTQDWVAGCGGPMRYNQMMNQLEKCDYI